MKEEILSIASDLREGFISTDEAKAQLLCLSSVVTQNELPEGRLLCLSSVATQSELLEGWVDLNTLSLEQMAEHLRNKYMYSSSGDAKCIYHLLEFYDKHKNLPTNG